MSIANKLAQYKEWKSGVKHCTFNPGGPGVVRIHLIPPKFRLFGNPEYLLILNGYYILPLGYSWAVMLSNFIEEIKKYEGEELSENDLNDVTFATLYRTREVYSMISMKELNEDLNFMLGVIFEVARTGRTDAEIEKLSIREYAPNMVAPHRVDLMVSAMTDERGTWKCNQKCRFCYAAGQSLSGVRELTTEEWKRAIDKLKDARVPMVTFTGGEPTMREDLVELVEHSKWFVTRLNTNGVNLTADYVEKLKEASIDSIQVTLYSHDEGIHNKLVGCDKWADTVAGIKNAVAAGVDVSVNTPICNLNKDYVKTVEFVRSLGVRFITASGLICTGGAENSHEIYDLDKNELFLAVKEAKEYCNEQGMEIDFTSPGLIDKEMLENIEMKVPSCGAALSNMAIAPDGTVIPCQSWLTDTAGLGNILNDKFSDIWDHEICRKLRGMSDSEALECPFRKNKREVFENEG